MNQITNARLEGENFTAHEERGWWPGGPTDPNPTLNGVTQTTYTEWRIKQGLPDQNVHLMSSTEQTSIYDSYWNAGSCDEINKISPAVAICHMDCVFNAGAPRANKILQQTVGLLTQDGIIGPGTLADLTNTVGFSEEATVMAYLQNRWDFLQGLSNFVAWKDVWGGRENRMALLLGVPWTVS